jgi:thioesterase domain-containing protein
LRTLIENRLGKAPGLELIFKYPKLIDIANYLDGNDKIGANSVSLFQRLHTGNSNIEHILIPGVASTQKDFSHLILELKKQSNGSISILNHKGLFEDDKPFESVQENAAHFANLIKTHVKAANVNIIGHSYGGTLALETARQLPTYKKTKLTLVLLDTYFKQCGLGNGIKLAEINHVTIFDDWEENEHLKSRFNRLYKKQVSLFSKYKPRVLHDVQIKFVFAKATAENNGKYRKYIDKVFSEKIDILDIDGDHFSMLKGGNAAIISEKVLE